MSQTSQGSPEKHMAISYRYTIRWLCCRPKSFRWWETVYVFEDLIIHSLLMQRISVGNLWGSGFKALPQRSSLGLKGTEWASSACHPSVIYSSDFHKKSPAHWFPTPSLPPHTDKKSKVTISYQIISSQHFFLHIWNCPQRLQIREVVFHHKRDWRSIVTGDEPGGQGQQALLQTGNWRKSTQFLNRHYGILWGSKHGIRLLSTWHITEHF